VCVCVYIYIATRLRKERSSPSRRKTSLFFKTSGAAVGSTQVTVQWVPGFFAEDKVTAS
jgi:hypothetical protein